MAGSCGSFGGAGGALAADGAAVLPATGEPFRAGAVASLVVALAGISGLIAAPLIFAADLSACPRLLAFGMTAFVLALVAEGVAAESTAVSGLGWALAETLAESAGFFAADGGSVFAGAVGMIEAILSFSTSTYPKSVLTLNMFSSYATITPYSFLPSLRRISSAEPGSAASAMAQSDASRNPRFARTPILRVWAGPGKRRNWLAGHVSALLRDV